MNVRFAAGTAILASFMALGALALGGRAAHAENTAAGTVPSSALTSALRWRNVGPYVGGRVIAVAGVASKPGLFYMGSTGGGVWKTDNYGSSWTNLSDKYFKSNNIGAIAVAPSDPRVIYVGTGESDARNELLTGDGMYKSTDGGKTWQHIGLDKTHIISWITIDPTNPDIVYVAALGHVWGPNPQRGVYKTTDGGKTWKKILFVNDQSGGLTLAMDPANPNTLYATTWQMMRRHWTFSSGGPGSRIYKTTDGGATWTNITHNSGLPTGIFGKVGIALAPSNPNVLYALIQAKYKGEPGGLFRSDNAGQTWKLVNTNNQITQRAFYYMRVYVDPKDPNTIYLPNVSVFVSHDGGKKLTALHPPHGDNHAFWINPQDPEIFIEGNDGGATVTRDGGKTWSSEHNQPTAQIYHVTLNHQFPYNIYAAQQDEGAWMGWSAVRSGKIPAVWKPAAGGESAWLASQPGKPWITYGNGYFALMNRLNSRTGVDQSISPSPIYHDGAPASELTYRANWMYHPNLFIPGTQTLLSGFQYVMESTNYGHSWTPISPDLTRHDLSKETLPGGPISADISGAEIFDTISAMAVSPVDTKVIWTGSDDGLVYVTQDGGGHWTEVRPKGLPKWITITCIDASPFNAGTAYLTASQHQWDNYRPYVYKTTDFGKHWTAISSGLPQNEYVDSVRQDPGDAQLLLLATSRTVYVSFNDGAAWQPLTLNLPPVRVFDIEIQAQQHAVVLGTHGRGVWILDNLQALEQMGKAAVAANAPYLFSPQQTWLVKRSTHGFGGGSHQPGGTNLAPGATVFFYLPSSYKKGTPVSLTFTTSDGQVVNTYSLPWNPPIQKGAPGYKKPPKVHPLHAGVNRFLWDFRYSPAVYPKGFYVTEGTLDEINAPTVVPGTYNVVLTYAGQKLTEPFTIKLDPRLHTTQAQMQARLDLLLKINDTLQSLDTRLNAALAARTRVEKMASQGGANAGRAQKILADLDRDIGSMVQLKIQSNEGDLVFETRVMERLVLLSNDIQGSYTPLRPTNLQGFQILDAKAKGGEARLAADVESADRLTGT